MSIIGGKLGYMLLKAGWPRLTTQPGGDDPYVHHSKLEVAFGSRIFNELKGKSVIDFGCGVGRESVAIAQHGAARVIGIDIRDSVLQAARERAREAGVANTCTFTQSTDERCDVVISLDSFEHFAEPAEVLRSMHGLLRLGGRALIEFGPPWFHPYGGHLFSVFPWAHLIFTERSLIRWRSDFKEDGATRFSEVSGGLNQMNISRFLRFVDRSDFRIVRFEAVPIRATSLFFNRWTREFLTSIVRCELAPK
jgi:SAM-dependent methyltransferase